MKMIYWAAGIGVVGLAVAAFLIGTMKKAEIGGDADHMAAMRAAKKKRAEAAKATDRETTENSEQDGAQDE